MPLLWTIFLGSFECAGTFYAITARASDLVETVEVEGDGAQCLSCRARFALYARIRGECKHAPDQIGDVDLEIEDRGFRETSSLSKLLKWTMQNSTVVPHLRVCSSDCGEICEKS